MFGCVWTVHICVCLRHDICIVTICIRGHLKISLCFLLHKGASQSITHCVYYCIRGISKYHLLCIIVQGGISKYHLLCIIVQGDISKYHLLYIYVRGHLKVSLTVYYWVRGHLKLSLTLFIFM